ncbi:MAG: flgD [Rickettsiales bacterium]|jgi:flagellar basal-body rod modification protein FlgD|nr:flgD [Rickettsiales bacterium]
MAIGNIGDIKGSANPTTSVVKKDGGLGLAETFDDFLLLLTTQLKNQDPTQPLDTNQFTQQLVSFAGVEQSVNTNTNLEKLINLTQQTGVSNAITLGTSFLGKRIEANGNMGALVDGKTSFSYRLEEGVSSSFITVKDADDKVVYTEAGQSRAGEHTFNWDGRDASGRQLKDGVYKFEVKALDKDKNSMTVSTAVTGTVTGLMGGNGGAQVLIGDVAIPIEQIRAVYTIDAPIEGETPE